MKSKKLAGLIAGILMVAALGGCGGSNAQPVNASVAPSSSSEAAVVSSSEAPSSSTPASSSAAVSSEVSSEPESSSQPALENGLLVAKSADYAAVEIRYVTPAGTPIEMENKFVNIAMKNTMHANLESAVQAGDMLVIDNKDVLVIQAKTQSTIGWVFTPIAATAPAGYNDTKKEIPITMTFDVGDENTYAVYTITCDYEKSLVEPTFDVEEK